MSELWNDLVQRIADWLEGYDFLDGVIAGAGLCLALSIVLYIAYLVVFRRKRCRGITMSSDAGDLVITIVAVREFVRSILHEFSEASMHGISLQERRGGLDLTIDLDVLPDVPVVPLVTRLREEVTKRAADQLGIDLPIRVHVAIRSLAANERKIARAARKAVHHAPPEHESKPMAELPETTDEADESFLPLEP